MAALKVPLPTRAMLAPLFDAPVPSNVDEMKAYLGAFLPFDLDDLEGLPQALDAMAALPGHLPFWTETLPFIVDQARRLFDLFPEGLQALPSGELGVVSIPRASAVCLLANMFLCTFDAVYMDTPGAKPLASILQHLDFPFRTLQSLHAHDFPQETAKLACHIHYFERMLTATRAGDGLPAGNLYFRRLVGNMVESAVWAASEVPLTPLVVHDKGVIEDAVGCLQLDFANAYLGGGALGGGCVQEEILFSVAPEYCIGCMLAPRMEKTEALLMTGAERFSATKGYAFSLRYDGDFVDPVPRAGASAGGAEAGAGAFAEPDVTPGTPLVTVLALDAVQFVSKNIGIQLREHTVLRELSKAFIGFSGRGDEARTGSDVATGNWGCGAFHGHHQLKALLQWMAASQAERAVQYYTFGDKRISGLPAFVAWARGDDVKVGEVFRALRVLKSTYGLAHDFLEAVMHVVTCHREGKQPSPEVTMEERAPSPVLGKRLFGAEDTDSADT